MNRSFFKTVTALTACMCLWACDDDEERAHYDLDGDLDGSQSALQDAAKSDSHVATDAADAQSADAGPSEEQGEIFCGSADLEPHDWILIEDATQGIGMGATFGCDIDAIEYSCPDGQKGSALSIQGHAGQNVTQSNFSKSCGSKSESCNTASECAALLGVSGSLLASFDRNLQGCQITVFEQGDMESESCRVSHCSDPEHLTRCQWLFNINDGQTGQGTVP